MWIGLIPIYTSIQDGPYLRYYWEKPLNHIWERSMIVLDLVHRMEDVRCVPNMFVRNWLAVVNVIHNNVRGLLAMIEESSILLYRSDPAGLVLLGWQGLCVLWYQIDLSSWAIFLQFPLPALLLPAQFQKQLAICKVFVNATCLRYCSAKYVSNIKTAGNQRIKSKRLLVG